jgi:hypothetical protein
MIPRHLSQQEKSMEKQVAVPKEIRHRYVQRGQTEPERTIAPEKSVGKRLPAHIPDIDPKSMTFMLGLIFFLEPEKEPEREPFPEGERFVCD